MIQAIFALNVLLVAVVALSVTDVVHLPEGDWRVPLLLGIGLIAAVAGVLTVQPSPA